MKKIYFILITLFFSINIFCVFDDYEPSTKARALGGAFSAIGKDANTIFYNPAYISEYKAEIITGYTRLFGTDYTKLITFALSYKLPGKWGNIGLGMQSFGVEYKNVNLMNENFYALSHAFTLMKDIHSSLNVGYVLNMFHLEFDEMGSQNTFGINLGVKASLHERTNIGFYVKNINNPTIGQNNNHDLPKSLVCGISYEPYKTLTTTLDIEKKIDAPTELHGGMELFVTDMFALRFGVRNEPVSFSGGIGINFMNFVFDYSINTHSMLGLTHHISFGYFL